MALKQGDLWFPYRRPQPGARVRLFCFPHAGAGAATFREYGALAPDVEVAAVQLPGREGRVAEPLVAEMAALTAPIVDAIARLPPLPFAFYGHSMGAVLAFEVARALRRRGDPLPFHLLAAACPAPHFPDTDDAHTLPDGPLTARLRALGDTPEEVLAHAELMEMILPIYRADAALTETYAYAEEAPLDLPLTAVGGRDDPRATRADLAGWRQHTRAAFALETVPGGHLFLHTAKTELLAVIRRALA